MVITVTHYLAPIALQSPREEDGPEDEDAVIYLAGLAEVFFYEISILATVSDNLVDELNSSKLLACLIVWAGTKASRS